MAINADLLAPGSSVFYLRGTTGERVPATIVGLVFPGVSRHQSQSSDDSGHGRCYLKKWCNNGQQEAAIALLGGFIW